MLSRFFAASLLISALAHPAGALVDPTEPAEIEPVDLGAGWTAQFGVELRVRAMNTDNFSLTGASPTGDNFYLTRVRPSVEVSHESGWGFYLEAIDARTTSSNVPALGIDQNDLDMRNAFVSFRMADTSIKVGRQDLLYGNQRLVSPLDWANTRRAFEGAVFTQETSDGFVDVFITKPVIVDPHNTDHDDDSVTFSGVYYVAGQEEGSEAGFDAYLLHLNESTDKIATALPSPDVRGLNLYTYGTRLWGTPGDMDWEFEIARQSGNSGANAHRAWMAGARAGFTFEDVPLSPRLGMEVEFGSGDDDPTDSTTGTFNQLFPLGHRWLGELDRVARANVLALIPNLTLQLDERTKVWIAYNYFRMHKKADSLYNAGGGVLFTDPTGNSGDNIGAELDIIITHKPENLPFADVIRLGLSSFDPGRFVEIQGSTKVAQLAYLEIVKTF